MAGDGRSTTVVRSGISVIVAATEGISAWPVAGLTLTVRAVSIVAPGDQLARSQTRQLAASVAIGESACSNTEGALLIRNRGMDDRQPHHRNLAVRRTKAVDDHGEPLTPPWGPTRNGAVCFQADGRSSSVLGDGRPSLPAGEGAVFIACTGNYTVDGRTLTTRVDGVSDPSRSGGDPERS